MNRLGRCRKFISRNISTAPAPAPIGRTKFGWEATSFSDPDLQCALLEKSLNNGCRTIVGASMLGSTPHDFSGQMNKKASPLYELISDLTASDDLDLSTAFIGHRFLSFRNSNLATSEQITSELDGIVADMRHSGRSLDFVTVSLPTMAHTKGAHITSVEGTINMCRTAISELEKASKVSSSSSSSSSSTSSSSLLGRKGLKNGNINSIDVGIDLTTEFLTSSSDEQLLQIRNELLQFHKQVSPLSILTVACNALTAEKVLPLIEWARTESITVVGTETLRVDPRRPGLLSLEGIERGNAIIRRNKDSLKEEHESAMIDLKRAIDSCLHVEMQFLEKLNSKPLGGSKGEGGPLVDPKTVCIAHLLVQAQHTIAHSEEWSYLQSQQLQPKLLESVEKLKAISEEHKNWAAIYAPMARYLISCFSKLLFVRKQQHCFEVSDTLMKTHAFKQLQNSINDEASDNLCGHLAILSSLLGTDNTLLPYVPDSLVKNATPPRVVISSHERDEAFKTVLETLKSF